MGTLATELDLPRPSYERLRLYVHEMRRRRRAGESREALLLDVGSTGDHPMRCWSFPKVMEGARETYDHRK